MHAWSWSEVCKPKTGGGLGIRRLTDVSVAAGIRLFWRLSTSNTLWASWMSMRYIKNQPWESVSASSLRNLEILELFQV